MLKQQYSAIAGFLVFVLVLSVPEHAFGQSTKENADFKLAVNLFNDGMYDLAAEQLRSFIASYPSTSQSIEARFYLGLTYLKIKKFEDARQVFQNFALSYVDHPKAPDAWVHVAEAFYALGNIGEAASAYERVRIFHPKSSLVPEALLNAAKLHRGNGDRDQAKRALRTIIQEFPASRSALPARLAISEMYAEEGQTELAESEARRVSESDAPPAVKANALFSLGTIQVSAGLFPAAEESFTSVTTAYKGTPAAVAAYAELGSLALSRKKFEEAIDFFEKVVDSDQADDSLKAGALFYTGIARVSLRDYKSASKAFRRLLDIYPESPLRTRATLEAGEALLNAGDEDAALELALAILDHPAPAGKESACILAARAAERKDDVASAVRFYLRFGSDFRQHPGAAGAILEAATLTELRLRDPRKAMPVYDEIIQSFPRAPEVVPAMQGLARCQEQIDDVRGSLRTLEELIRRFPAHDSTDAFSRRAAYLEHHRLKDRDAGMEKLARLLGEILTSERTPRLAFQLGLIYYNEMKDYPAAIRQFTTAIDSGLDEDDFRTAYLTRARAYDRLSDLDPEARQNAILYYDSYLRQFPSGAGSDEAAFRSYRLKSIQRPASGVRELASEFLKTGTRSPQYHEVLADRGAAELATGNPTAAIRSWKELIRDHPGSPFLAKAWLSLGQAYTSLNTPDSAVMCWKKAITIPGSSAAVLQALISLADDASRGKKASDEVDYLKRISSEYFYTTAAIRAEDRLPEAYLAAGNHAAAISRLRAKIALIDAPSGEKTGEDLYVRLAAAYERKGEKQEATSWYLKYLRLNPSGPHAGTAYLALGGLARNGGKSGLAATYFQQAAALGGTGSVSREVADLLFQSEQYTEAVRQYTQLASADSGVNRMYYRSRIIVGMLRLGKVAETRALVENFRKAYPKQKEDLAEFEYERGLVSYRKQEYEPARKIFEDLADDYSGTRLEPWGLFYLGKIAEVNNKPEDAAKRYDAVLKKFPQSDVVPRVFLSLGNMHFNVERFEDAIRNYQKIVEDPARAGDILPFAMNNLIEAYESTRLYDNALQVARDFVTRFPGDESIMDKKIKIGSLYSKLGYYDQAVLHLQNLIDEAGSLLEAELRYTIGEAFYYKGDYQQAILEFLKVPYLSSRQGKIDWTATSLYMAGQSYEKISRFDEALGMYQQIVDRTGIDATFKSAARKEIERVKQLTKKGSK